MQTHSSPSDSDNSWHREFPRLAELRDSAPLTGIGTFFHSIPETVAANPLAREVFQEHEIDLAALDEYAWCFFKSKLLRSDLKSHGHRGYIGIHSILYKAKGYWYLKQELRRMNLEYDQIVLIPEEVQKKTPEWAAFWQGTPVGVLEVKTVYESDDQSNYVYENTQSILEHGEATARRAHSRISDAFWQKLRSTADRARVQLDSYVPIKSIPRIALVIVHFDYDLAMAPANYASVASFLDGLSSGMFQVVYQFRGLNAPTEELSHTAHGERKPRDFLFAGDSSASHALARERPEMSKPIEEFEKLTQALALEAQSAKLDHQLWQNLTNSPERHEIAFSQSRVFWQMTFEAHFNSCLFRLCRLYDHQKSSFNLGRWLALIKRNPNWFTSAAYESRRPGSTFGGPPDPTQLAMDIDFASEKTNPLLKNLTKFRGNVLAHMGREYLLRDKRAPAIFKMTYGDVTTLVEQAVEIINRYTQIYNGNTYSANMAGLDDFSFILEAVRERVQRLRGEE